MILLLSFAACGLARSPLTFEEYVQRYGKSYHSHSEYARRKAIFDTNLIKIAQLNGEHNGTVLFQSNTFSDLSQEEFSSKILMPRRSAPVFPKDR